MTNHPRSRPSLCLSVVGENTELVHCTITGRCLHMRHRPSAPTLYHVTVPIRNIYRVVFFAVDRSVRSAELVKALRSLVNSVPGHFRPIKEDQRDQGAKWM